MKRSAAGDRVALIEQSPTMYGGTCINIGCIPTKKLLFETSRGTTFPEAVSRRDQLIGTLNATNLRLAQGKGVTVIDGFARFSGDHEITVTAGQDTLILHAPTIVINTGSEPIWPDLPGSDHPKLYDSTTIQHISPLPKRLAIIGGGPIGLEFATLFSGQGSEVTILDHSDTPLRHFDSDIAKLARTDLENRGITFLNNVQVTGFSDDLTIHLTDRDLNVDAALIAIGRRPATANLGLSQAGIKIGSRGEVLVDAHLHTNISGIYAVGDVNGGPQFTYVSYDDHRIVLDQLADSPNPRSTSNRLFPTTTFLEPPLSTIGITEKDAGDDVLIKKGLINTVALAMRHGITASELGSGIYTHPSTSEIFNQVLES